MKRDGDWPLIAADKKALGVIVGDSQDADLPVDDQSRVSPQTGGMSVNAAWRTLPYWRIPRRLTHLLPEAAGSNQLYCWRFGEGVFESAALDASLKLRVDHLPHGLVEPTRVMPLRVFEDALGATQKLWTVDEA